MKVKTIKHRGYYRLVCDDEAINQKYECTQDNPITLASMHNWEMTPCWYIRDMRLENACYPSPHLEGSNTQTYMPTDEEDAQNLKAQLQYYKEAPNGEIKWGTFAGIVGMGDRTDHPDNPSWVAKALEGCWSYNGARAKFKEIREFWKQFKGDDFESAMMENPHKQMSEFDYKMQKGMYSGNPPKRKPK